MRLELQKREGQRDVYFGTFVRYGSAIGWKGKPVITLLFNDIRDINGIQVADHLWFRNVKCFEELGPLVPGEKIRMRARPKPYRKGYRGFRDDYQDECSTDFKLAFPTEVERVDKQKQGQLQLI